MKHYDRTLKQVTAYILGLLILTLGISLSIYAGLGVSPVSSLAYALTLSTHISVGTTTILTNIIFILIQWILSKKFKLRTYFLQLIVAFMFGFFTDFTFWLVRLFLPYPPNLAISCLYLIASLFVVALGLLLYLNARLPMMPYDALTYVISDTFNIEFSRAKITSDLLNVVVAAVFCLITLHNFGSIGIGTFIAAYFIGKILGIFIKIWKNKLVSWMMFSKFE